MLYNTLRRFQHVTWCDTSVEHGTCSWFMINHLGFSHNLRTGVWLSFNINLKKINDSHTSSCADASSSALLASGSPAKGPRRVCRKSAAFLFLSACSCFSLDSLDAWASFSLAAAARRSSSFCLAKGRKERRKEVAEWRWNKTRTERVICPHSVLTAARCTSITLLWGRRRWLKGQKKMGERDVILCFSLKQPQMNGLWKAKNWKREERQLETETWLERNMGVKEKNGDRQEEKWKTVRQSVKSNFLLILARLCLAIVLSFELL